MEWAARRFAKLLNFIGRLPSYSAYSEALAQDEELAALMLDQPPPEDSGGERWSEWSPIRGDLAVIADRLGELIRINVSAAGGKPPKVRPMPRPQAAIVRERNRRRMSKHRELTAILLPHKAAATSS